MGGYCFADLDDCALAYQGGQTHVVEEILAGDFDGPGVLLESYVTVSSWDAGEFVPRSTEPLVERFKQGRNGHCSLPALSKQTDMVFGRLSSISSENVAAFVFALGIAAQNGMAGVGIPENAAKSVAGAIGELVGNIRDHSGRADSGVIGAACVPNGFEFVAADCGRGALAGYLENSEFAQLRDEGDALRLAVIDHVSRHGRNSGGGTGFQTLLRALSSLDASVRIRSGDQGLIVNGTAANREYTLDQKARLQGFVVSARISLGPSQ
jgi:hypothetical protein